MKISEEHKNLISHIERYEKERMVKDVLLGDSRFVDELKKFYNVEIWRHLHRFGCYYTCDFQKLDNSRINSKPSLLVEIVGPFHNEGIDILKLEYQSVILDNKLARKKTPEQILTGTLFVGTLLAIPASFVYAFENPYIGVPLTLATFYSHYKIAMKGMPKNKNCTGSYDEFWKLFHATRTADSFISTNYKQYLLEKTLVK